MSIEEHQIQFGESIIQYSLSYSPRKTLAISVHPDLTVTVDAPEQSDFAAIEANSGNGQRDLEKYHPPFAPASVPQW